MNSTPSVATEPTLLEVDSRGRVALGPLRRDRSRYLARALDDGSILLEPAVVISEAEARLHANPELHDQVRRAASEPDRAVRGRRG